MDSHSNKFTPAHITRTDIAVSIFCIYIFISGLAVSGMEIGNIIFLKWSICALLYILARLNRHKEAVLAAITAAGIAQGIAAIGQQIGLMESRHPLFWVTGFMGNPGQLGGFQAIAFSCCILLMSIYGKKSRTIKLALSASCIFLACTLLISGSRAGLLAAISGICIVHINEIHKYIKKHRRHIPVYAALCLAASAAIVMYRSESVMARLLIWNVTSGMIADRPLLGCGAGMFKMNYMGYQADYFARNPESRLAGVADNVIYPYNEFLHITAETGIIGFVLVLAMLIMIFREAGDKRLLSPLAALIVFSCFSYPLSKFSLAVLFPLLAGSIGTGSKTRRTTRGIAALTALSLLLTAVSAYTISVYRDSINEIRSMKHGYEPATAEMYAVHFRRIYTDNRINALTASLCGIHPELLDHIEDDLIIPGCESQCILAEYHIGRNGMAAGEKYLVEASCMIPTRIRPQYMLWKLYLSTGKYAEAKAAALRIAGMEVKVSSTFSIRAKAEAMEWLGHVSPHS